MNQCKSTFTRHSGEVLRCQMPAGHSSAHLNGDIWWPNKDGLPFGHSHRENIAAFILIGVIAVIALVTLWLVLHR